MLLGVLFGAVIAEIVLRMIGYSYPVFYMPDATRGYALRPNMEGWYRKEGEAYIKINSDGLRDREHAKTKPPDTIRIALIGDSYPEAFPVALEDSFWAVMEERLRACGAFVGKKIEVINFGVSGYSTAQELIALREQAWAYSPDIVMLAVTTNNDISDNSRALKKTDEVPYFVYRDGKLVLDDSFTQTRAFRLRRSTPNRIGSWIRDHLRLIQAINQAHHGFKNWLSERRNRAAPVNSATPAKDAGVADDPGIDNLIYREPGDQVWNDAWRVTEGLIVEMRDEVKAKGASFVVVTLSNGVQVYPNAWVRETFMKRLGINDLFYPDHRIKSLCERQAIPVITLAPQMQAYADQNKVILHGFGANVGNGHWNQLGNRVAGELIAKDLCNGALR